MTPQALIEALALPSQAMVNQRVPKKLLVESGAPTAADKRLIQDGIEDFFWVASLKPDTIGVPAFRDDAREYLELAVLSLTPRAAATPRLAELVHRAVPYPVLLIVADAGGVSLSLSHIRWAQREAARTVLDGPCLHAQVPTNDIGQAFAQAMALVRQPRSHLLDLYQGWIDTTTALQVAELTGQFSPSTNQEDAAARRATLHQCVELKTSIAQLRTQAAKEKQMPRQVALNLEIRSAQASLQDLLELIGKADL